MMFHVGQKVVCVDAPFDGLSKLQSPLVEGNVYTVVRIEKDYGLYRSVREHYAVVLAEVKNPYPLGDGFASPRFRPVAKRKTDISIFKELLTDPQKKIEETVY